MESSDDLGELKSLDNNALFETFKKCPDIIMNFNYFDSDVKKSFFTADQVDEINAYLKDYFGFFLMELKKVKSSNISLNKLNYLCRLGVIYLNYEDDLVQKYLLLLYKKVLNLNECYKNEVIYSFIIKYTAKLAAESLSIPMPMIVISNYRYNSDELMDSVYGNFSHKLNVITINEKFVSARDDDCKKNVFPVSKLSSILHTVAHEVKHARQKNDSKEKRLNENSYIYAKRILFNEFLCDSYYDEYKKNYNYTEIELDAELFSWLFTGKIIDAMCLDASDKENCLLNYYYTLEKKNLNIKKDKRNNWYQGYKYNIELLEHILIFNPQKLKYYPVLKIFFKGDGTLKDIHDLLKICESNKNNIDKDLSNTINKYFNYHFQNMNLNDFDFSKYDDRDLLLNKLLDVIIWELNAIKDSFKQYFDIESEHLEFINCERLNDVLHLFDILIYNKKCLPKNFEYNNKREIIRQLILDIKKETRMNKYYKSSNILHVMNKLNRVKI